MAIGIGLDNSGDLDFRANYGPDAAEIKRNLLAGNQNVGAIRNGHYDYGGILPWARTPLAYPDYIYNDLDVYLPTSFKPFT